jgi:hypothetical protein
MLSVTMHVNPLALSHGSSVLALRSAAIHCQANARDLLPALTSLSLPEIVSGLHRKPGLGRSAQCLLKSDRHVRANGGLAMDNPDRARVSVALNWTIV